MRRLHYPGPRVVEQLTGTCYRHRWSGKAVPDAGLGHVLLVNGGGQRDAAASEMVLVPTAAASRAG